jgi:hypothetical protein
MTALGRGEPARAEYAGGHGYGISWATTSGRPAGAAAVAA